MLDDVSVVLLAGGRGSRMGELTATRQKLMMDVNGRPVLRWVLNGVSAAFDKARVVVSTGYRAEEIEDYFGTRYEKLDLHYVSDPDTRGTVWGLALARPFVGDQFLFVGGDVVVQPQQLHEVTEAFDFERPAPYMGVVSGGTRHEPAPGHALIVADDGELKAYYPDTKTVGAAHEYRDLHLGYYRSTLLDYFADIADRQNYVEYALQEALAEGMTFGFSPYPGPWYHFKYAADFDVSIVL
jgi:NDP-sugar pyrophosphorylase family protein